LFAVVPAKRARTSSTLSAAWDGGLARAGIQ